MTKKWLIFLLIIIGSGLAGQSFLRLASVHAQATALMSYGSGAPSSPCTDRKFYTDLATGNQYTCIGTTWTIQATSGGLFNVKDYGAVGNGSTDDTTAIAATITAVGSTGGCLYFPQGTYLVSSALTISNSMCIEGATQAGVTVKLANSSNVDVFDVTASNVYFRQLTVEGNAANQSTTSYGIHGATTLSNLTLSYVTVQNAKTNDVYMISGSNVSIDHCAFTGALGNAQFIYTVPSSTTPSVISVTNTLFDDTAGSYGSLTVDAFITVSGTSGSLKSIIFSNNTVKWLNNGSTESDALVISNGGTGSPISQVSVTNNTFLGTAAATSNSNAIETWGVDQVSISGNLILNPYVGILVNQPASSSAGTVSNNTVIGQSSSSSSVGIYIDGTKNHFSVSGNSVSGMVLDGINVTATQSTASGNTVITPTNGNGIHVKTGADVTVVGNVISGAGNYAIYQDGSTESNEVYFGNIIQGVSYGFRFNGTTYTQTVAANNICDTIGDGAGCYHNGVPVGVTVLDTSAGIKYGYNFNSNQAGNSSACETAFATTSVNTGSVTTTTGLNCLPANSVIDAVVYRITTTITTAATFTVGISGTTNLFCTTQSTLTSGTTGSCFAQTGANAINVSAAPVVVTFNAMPAAGAIRLIVYYHTWTVPSG